MSNSKDNDTTSKFSAGSIEVDLFKRKREESKKHREKIEALGNQRKLTKVMQRTPQNKSTENKKLSVSETEYNMEKLKQLMEKTALQINDIKEEVNSTRMDIRVLQFPLANTLDWQKKMLNCKTDLEGVKLALSKWCCMPQRYVLGLMGFLGVINVYLMRVVLSIAIIEMVVPVNKVYHEDSDTCPDPDDKHSSTVSTINSTELYTWNEEIQGLVLSSFYWGYVLTHLPGGILAEKFGGKYTLGLSILSTAVFTVLTPLVVKAGDWPWLIVLRVFVGLGEGIAFPALSAMLAKWVPLSERSRIGTLVFSGAQMGNVIGNALSGIVIDSTKSWESVFYVFGTIGILWFILWVILCYSDPQSHPFITENEKNFLEKELTGITKEKRKIPWKHILRSYPLWALVVAQLGHDWGLFTMISDLPKYMKSVLKFNVKQSGIWASIPYMVMWIVAMLSGWLCDHLIVKGYMKITFARKFFTSIASIGPGIFILAASYAGCDRILTVTFFTIGMGFMGTFYCGIKVNPLDLSPNFAGTIMAIVNGLGALSGIITPYLAGALTEDQTLTQWRTVFWITLGVFIFTNAVYVVFASGKEQWWNSSDVINENETEQGNSNNFEKNRSKFLGCCMPQRYILGLMGFLGIVNIVLMRVVLSIAIIEMVVPVNTVNHKNSDTCPDQDDKEYSTVSTINKTQLYNWNEEIQGIILSSFYLGYVATQVPGGIIAEKFGGKYTMGLSIFLTAIFTLLTPLVVKVGDWPWLIVVRIFVGFGQGVVFPALTSMLAKWVPQSERSRIGTLAFSGVQIGNVIGNALSGIIIDLTKSWESIFYISGTIAILWFILWVILCYSDPQSHPFITENEKKFLEKELTGISKDKKKIPWKHILKSKPLWALVLAQLGQDWGLLTMMSDLPKYMKSVLKFNVKQSGIWASLPYMVMWIVAMLSGWLCDHLIVKGYTTITFARKFFASIAFFGPGIFLLAASYAGCDRIFTVAFFTIGMGLMGTFYCGIKVNMLDLSPNFAGTLMAIVNSFGALSGIISPYLAGVLTKDNSTELYRWSEEVQGLVLSSFYWGYVATHLPGGIIAEKFGGKYTMGLSILSTAIFTLLTPMVVKAGDWPWLIVLRIFVGFGEGTVFPALTTMLAKWVPPSERSRIGTLAFSGVQMGNIIGNTLSGIIIDSTKSWESVFYIFGIIGIIWFVLWVILCYSDPQTHPFITKNEKIFLEKELTGVSKDKKKIPWKHILKSEPLWALVFAQIGHDWGLFTIMSDLPKFMKSILKFNVKQSGIWASLPYMMMWIVAMLSGWLCDHLIVKGYMKITFARKFFTSIASIGPGIFMLAASYAGCDRILSIAFFTIGMGLMGTFNCGIKVNPLDLSPNFAGTITAIVSGLGAISGIITPYLAGALTKDNSTELYRWSEEIQGLVLSSFYWGYVLTHLPGAIIAEKFGGKYTMGLSILSTAIFTLLTPLVVKAGDWPWLIVLRIFVGFGEGTVFPALAAMLAKWVPSSERSRIGTLAFSGVQMGNIVGNTLSGIIIDSTKSWESVFYTFGTIGILWFILWVILCFSDSQSHPFITENEKIFLEKELTGITKEKRKIPWKHILRSYPLWALVVAQLGYDWGLFTMISDLPKYMKSVLKFNVKQSGIWASLPYMMMWIVAMFSGWLCDYLIVKGYMKITFARKFFTSIAFIGPGIFILAASYAGCDRVLAVAFFTIGIGLMGTFNCGIKVNPLDLAPNFAGTITAIVSGLGATSGIITPYLAGALRKDSLVVISCFLTIYLLYNTTVFYYVYSSFRKVGSFPDLYCYELNHETLPDISTKTSPWEKSIYFLEVSCRSSKNGKISILPRQACAIESAAFNNPSFDVHVVYTSPGTIADEESVSDKLIHILLDYKNIKFLHVDFKNLIKDTPVEYLYKDGHFKNTKFPVIVSSDITRLLILQKYGGVYLDLDVIVLKSLLDLPSDYVGVMLAHYANNAVLRFSQNDNSQQLIQHCLELLSANNISNEWDYTGPQVLSKTLTDFCQDKNLSSTPFKDCNGFKIFPPEKFYPIRWEDWELYFKHQDSDKLLNSILEDSYIVHVWNKMSKNVDVTKEPNSIYNTLGKKFCPRVFEAASEFF
ncbi:hypothetical protein RN001_014013 [Aquatica leii]|uniref:Major facilitator superfamily (MFS) profile domain-containing protein n=1 Tax=Aquatica leii TaxID=1421715 RepID=A0AAN7QDL8_9COLE|nr:hypothetical protein RN001_014013 [Aquatica leii]